MPFFRVGFWTGVISFIVWVLFDQRILMRMKWFGDVNKWLKSSYRRSIALDLALIAGFFTIQARLLDMANGFVAVMTTATFVVSYNTMAVSKNKMIAKVKGGKDERSKVRINSDRRYVDNQPLL